MHELPLCMPTPSVSSPKVHIFLSPLEKKTVIFLVIQDHNFGIILIIPYFESTAKISWLFLSLKMSLWSVSTSPVPLHHSNICSCVMIPDLLKRHQGCMFIGFILCLRFHLIVSLLKAQMLLINYYLPNTVPGTEEIFRWVLKYLWCLDHCSQTWFGGISGDYK